MPEHIKNAKNDSREFNSYLKGFIDSRLEDNTKKNLQAVAEKTRKVATNIIVMLAG